MNLLVCPRPSCGTLAFQEDLQCRTCGAEVAYHTPSHRLVEVSAQGTLIDGRRWYPCSNRQWLCNWLVAADSGTGRCFSCRLTRRRPDADDTVALEKLASTAQAKRRLLGQLHRLGLPVDPHFEGEGGLGFDLISSHSAGEKVLIGHANGIITIDLVESLDSYREQLRIKLGEPYRTMLGHFRHEVGHYYQWVLVESGPLIEECREIFGDERASYTEALQRHYRTGAPEGWQATYISEYATMHPWEDFAECFAHYLHITESLGTAALAGVTLDLPSNAVRDFVGPVRPRQAYGAEDFDALVSDWRWLAMMFNRVNRAMGKDDMYPFTITAPVVEKLAFVHRVLTKLPPTRVDETDGFRRRV